MDVEIGDCPCCLSRHVRKLTRFFVFCEDEWKELRAEGCAHAQFVINVAHMHNKPLTTAAAAEVLGVTVSTVNRMAERGELKPLIKFPGKTGARMFDPDEVERLLEARRADAQARADQ